MLPAYIAAAVAARRKAEESAEFARQIPLYAEEFAYPPPDAMVDGRETTTAEADGYKMRCQAPDWTMNY